MGDIKENFRFDWEYFNFFPDVVHDCSYATVRVTSNSPQTRHQNIAFLSNLIVVSPRFELIYWQIYDTTVK